jgi:hypothetical protein
MDIRRWLIVAGTAALLAPAACKDNLDNKPPSTQPGSSATPGSSSESQGRRGENLPRDTTRPMTPGITSPSTTSPAAKPDTSAPPSGSTTTPPPSSDTSTSSTPDQKR